MFKNQKGVTLFELLFVIAGIVFLAGVGGWVNNIVILANSDMAVITVKFIIRCFGILVFPLGMIMGYL